MDSRFDVSASHQRQKSLAQLFHAFPLVVFVLIDEGNHAIKWSLLDEIDTALEIPRFNRASIRIAWFEMDRGRAGKELCEGLIFICGRFRISGVGTQAN